MHAIAHAIHEQSPDKVVMYLSAEKFMYQFVKALRANEAMNFKELFRSVDVLMIDDVQFNAGKGSVFTRDGKNELDASIMECKDRKAGAVAGLTTVKNPILAAKAGKGHTPHVLLIAAGPAGVAKERGVERV